MPLSESLVLLLLLLGLRGLQVGFVKQGLELLVEKVDHDTDLFFAVLLLVEVGS